MKKQEKLSKKCPAGSSASAPEKIESVEGKILHPSLDVKGDIMVLGFRYRPSVDDEKNIFLVMKKRAISMVDNSTRISYEHDGVKEVYFLELKKKKRKLMWIDERWSLDELQEFVRSFPTINSTAPKPNELRDKIFDLTKEYIDLERNIDYILLSAWIIGTYFYPIFPAYPFLNVKAPKGSGKSQCLNYLRQVCFNAVKSRPTLAALGDTVDDLRGTYLIDQADSLDQKNNKDLLALLTDSYKKGGGKRRIINNSKTDREIMEFDIYAPKAFASIDDLDEDLRDRCLIIALFKSNKNFNDPDDDDKNWREIRGMIYKFLADNFDTASVQYYFYKSQYRESKDIVGRNRELWLPLEIMLRILGWEDKVEEAKNRFFTWYGQAEYEPTELEEAVVRIIYQKFGEKEKEELILSPKDIVGFIEFSDSELFDEKMQKTQRAAKVGRILKKFNLSSEKLRQTKYGKSYRFERSKVEKIYTSYFGELPPSPTSEQENTNINVDFDI